MNTQAHKETESQEVEFETEDDFELEIQDDTPEEDRGKPRRPEGAEPDVPDDEELESYSEGVKKRISKLRYEFHEERRAKEEALRIREEAIKFAEQARKDTEALRKQLNDGQSAVVNQAKARVETQLEQAKSAFKQAYENGDADAMLAAQTKLTELSNEMYRLSNYKPAPAPESTPAPKAEPAAPSSPQVPKPPQRALEWAQKNPWFQTDTEMTGYAFGVHERLVKSGVDPNSETYYSEIDSAMRSRFPEKFGEAEEVKTQQRQAGSVVAPAARSTSKNPRKIVLTTTQVALAKRLGLTPQQYAAQLMKEKTNG